MIKAENCQQLLLTHRQCISIGIREKLAFFGVAQAPLGSILIFNE